MLERTLRLQDPANVTVAVESGKVTLAGTVDNATDAALAKIFAAKVPALVEVESSLSWPGENGKSG